MNKIIQNNYYQWKIMMEPSGLERWPPACHAGALPSELWPLLF